MPDSIQSRKQIIDECLAALEKDDLETIELACTVHREMAAEIRALVRMALQLKQDAAASSAPGGEPSLVGGTIRHYKVLRELGRGGVGVVYEVHDSQLDRSVALKVLATTTASRQELQRFRREAVALARTRHPHITSIHDVGVTEQGRPFFVMDLVRGATLDERLKAIGAYEPASLKRADLVPDGGLYEKLGVEVNLRVAEGRRPVGSAAQPDPPRAARLNSYVAAIVRLGAQVADALDHAHQMSVVHRDVKPGNILLDADGAPHLADFGLAFGVGDDTATSTRAIRGTPYYMSPEQVAGDLFAIGPRSDVYALGVTLYHCLALRQPYRGESAGIIFARIEHGSPTKLRSLNRSVPPALEAVVMKAMHRRPERRYVSAAALRDDLRAVLDGTPVQARPPGRVRRAAGWVSRHPGSSALMGVVLLVLSIVLAVGSWIVFQTEWRRSATSDGGFAIHVPANVPAITRGLIELIPLEPAPAPSEPPRR